MAKKYVANVNTTSNVIAQGKVTGLSVSTRDGEVYLANENGAVTAPLVDRDRMDSIMKILPLTQWGDLNNPNDISVSLVGFTIAFENNVPLLMSGIYTLMPTQKLDLPLPNKRYFIYIELVQGVPKYKASDLELTESEVNMFIGDAITDGSGAISHTVKKTSRFGTFRPSINQMGSSFPVSTGHPSETGTINW